MCMYYPSVYWVFFFFFYLLPIDGQAGDSDWHFLPTVRGVEEAEGGLWSDANTAGVRETQLLWHHHLAWRRQQNSQKLYWEMLPHHQD